MSETAPPAPRSDVVTEWLQAPSFRIGQILGEKGAGGTWLLRHWEDAGRVRLMTYTAADAGSEIARYDDAGVYRPLKTAPNLRHGWMLQLARKEDVRLALDLIYPGRLAALSAEEKGTLVGTPFRETLARQSGMYRVAARITDEQADKVIATFCRSDGGCLRTILWKRDLQGQPASTLLPRLKFDPAVDQTGNGARAIPLLCQEACNLLVAKAREIVKAADESETNG